MATTVRYIVRRLIPLDADAQRATTRLDHAVDYVLRPARPDFLPSATAPNWKLIGPVVGHVLWVLGLGIMHPGVRGLVPRPGPAATTANSRC